MVLRVAGHVDTDGADRLLDLAASIAAGGRRVQIDLDGVEVLTDDAAAILLFRQASWRRLPETITLRATGRPSREAVLKAYVRRRARTNLLT